LVRIVGGDGRRRYRDSHLHNFSHVVIL
jgi:hypothetical protein